MQKERTRKGNKSNTKCMAYSASIDTLCDWIDVFGWNPAFTNHTLSADIMIECIQHRVDALQLSCLADPHFYELSRLFQHQPTTFVAFEQDLDGKISNRMLHVGLEQSDDGTSSGNYPHLLKTRSSPQW